MRQSRGFTLIEVMITVAIIAILAAIALPSYSDYVRRGRLTEALSAMSSQRVKMEQFFQDNRVYTNACAANTVATLNNTANFNFGCTYPTPGSYVVTGTGTGSMLGFVYTMTEANVRATTGLPTGWLGTGNACWVTKKDGSC